MRMIVKFAMIWYLPKCKNCFPLILAGVRQIMPCGFLAWTWHSTQYKYIKYGRLYTFCKDEATQDKLRLQLQGFPTKSSSTWKSKWPGGRFKNTYELLNPRALKISMLYKNIIFQCMGKIFCVEFQRSPLKFHTKYLTHTLKDMTFIQHWNFKSS